MHTPPPPDITCGFLIQLVFCRKKTMWFTGVEVEQETSAPPPKKNPGSAPGLYKEGIQVVLGRGRRRMYGMCQYLKFLLQVSNIPFLFFN